MEEYHNIALIGHKFMGRAHAQAYNSVSFFFPAELGKKPRLKILCGLENDLPEAAKNYGFEAWDYDYKNVLKNPGIDIADICTTDDTHKDIAVTAANEGKHIMCEKPLSRTLDEAHEMLEAVKKNKIKHMVNFIYRKTPAVMLAKKLIGDGKIGEIYHFNCFYKQDFCLDKNMPFMWRMDAGKAGGGTMADKGSHIIDLGRYLIGEFAEVCARAKVYIPYRKDLETGGQKLVTSNDASVFIAEFQNGATGCFQASNISAGEKNALIFEIHGEKGSIKFNLERLNELEVYFADGDTRGYRTVMVTEKEHPYIKNWWPEGHIIGWQNLFVHQIYEFLHAVENGNIPSPDFYDGLKCQEVVHALIISNQDKRWVKV